MKTPIYTDVSLEAFNSDSTKSPTKLSHTRSTHYKRTKKNKCYKKQGGKCFYCGKGVSFKDATIDHTTPLSRGGTWDDSNLKITCMNCNLRKANRTMSEYLDHLEYVNANY